MFLLEFTGSLKAGSRRKTSSLQNNPRGTLIVPVADVLLQLVNARSLVLVQHERIGNLRSRGGDPQKTHIKHTHDWTLVTLTFTDGLGANFILVLSGQPYVRAEWWEMASFKCM